MKPGIMKRPISEPVPQAPAPSRQVRAVPYRGPNSPDRAELEKGHGDTRDQQLGKNDLDDRLVIDDPSGGGAGSTQAVPRSAPDSRPRQLVLPVMLVSVAWKVVNGKTRNWPPWQSRRGIHGD